MRFIDRYLGKEAGLFFGFHRNRYAFLSLSLTFVHQVCIGLSVVSLIYLSEGIAKESEEYIAWFYAYLFLMVFPYIPGVLSQYYLGVWTNDLYIRFVKNSVESASAMGFSRGVGCRTTRIGCCGHLLRYSLSQQSTRTI